MKLTPSAARKIIERVWPSSSHPNLTESPTMGQLEKGYAPIVRAILDAAESVDETLVVENLDGEDLGRWFSSVAQIREVLEQWRGAGVHTTLMLGALMREVHPLTCLYDLLKKLPDEHKPAEEDRFSFVADVSLRRDLARDLAAAERLLALGEWKASTVIAGAVVEALLLDKLLMPALEPQVKASKSTPSDGKWTLEALIQVARELNVIEDADDERGALKAAQAFRNLIHPSKAQRLQRRADRSAAHVALGAALLLVEKFGGRP